LSLYSKTTIFYSKKIFLEKMNNNFLARTFSLLHVDYVKLNKRWNYNNVISPYYRLYYIDDGEGYITDKSEKLKLEAGYLYLIPSFTLCNLNCDKYLSQYFIQFFEKSPEGVSLFHNNRNLLKIRARDIDIIHFKRIHQLNPGRGINGSDNPEIYEKESFYREYQSYNKDMGPALLFENQGIILQLLSRFLKSQEFKSRNFTTIPSKILEAMSFIQLNLDKNLTISELAEKANQNKDYFSRQFLNHLGQRPLNYIHEKKIERAQYLITTTNKTFIEIAAKTGFSNVAHFSKIFKKVLGVTPGAYRSDSRNFN